REVNAAELAPGNRQIAWRAGAAGHDDGVEVAPQIGHGHVDADVRARLEDDAFLFHQTQAAVEMALFHLELGDAVAEQPADALGALEHDDRVSRPVELLGDREAGRARADDRDFLPRARAGRLGPDPALLERVTDDRDLDV